MTPDPTPYSKALLEAVQPTVATAADELLNMLIAGGVAISDMDLFRQFAELCIWHGVQIGTTAAAGVMQQEFLGTETKETLCQL